MLWTVLPTGAAEALANHLLSLDEQSPERFKKVAHKRVRVTLTELGKPFTVQTLDDSLRFSWVDNEPVDCHIMTRIAVLPELRDTANITRLIKADALDIDGDPLLAQQFSRLFVELDIDWQEQLAQRLGDVPAHFLSQAFARSRSWLEQALDDQKNWVRDVLIEEKQLLVSATEFDVFKQQLQQLRATVDRLEREIGKRKSK
ncbi:ubiquinone biosynthesis accessory factor UbiJ [Pseudidiomarina gelatinasegens]|uniref:ubiquinone biosynthesis accessory factor UbiJ n=1 Tax=Pseudidiomarina gelatinasegens TaxID=2487740 RepID=UPI0030EC38D4